MKKKLFLMCLIGLLSITSAYAKCDGGREVKNSVGTTFCLSNVDMNWWSAAAWCRANGLHLATMYEMCPSWDGNQGYGKCSELNGAIDHQFTWAWSATANGSAYAFTVNLSSAWVMAATHDYNRTSDGYNYAFCR